MTTVTETSTRITLKRLVAKHRKLLSKVKHLMDKNHKRSFKVLKKIAQVEGSSLYRDSQYIQAHNIAKAQKVE